MVVTPHTKGGMRLFLKKKASLYLPLHTGSPASYTENIRPHPLQQINPSCLRLQKKSRRRCPGWLRNAPVSVMSCCVGLGWLLPDLTSLVASDAPLLSLPPLQPCPPLHGDFPVISSKLDRLGRTCSTPRRPPVISGSGYRPSATSSETRGAVRGDADSWRCCSGTNARQARRDW